MSDIDKRLEEMAVSADRFKHEPDAAREQGRALAAALLRARAALVYYADEDRHGFKSAHAQDALDDAELEKAL